MGKRILVTSTDMMMIQFLVPHVLYLRNQGFDVEVACSEVGNRLDEVREKLGAESVHQVHLVRSPFRFQNLKGYHELKQLLNTEYYDLVWTNEPVMGIMTRLAARETRRKGTKVLYMTHGYHFFKGCQLRYKIFYPIEKIASNLCDCIVTISKEDFETTQKKFYAKQVYHIDGIGVDVKKYQNDIDTIEKKKGLNLPVDAFVVLSVGELKAHKNHEVIIKAISSLNDNNIFYLICGIGELESYLRELAAKEGIADNFRLLGYRRDVHEILKCVDVFAFPSKREGLGLASLEAMAAGVPILGSSIRGIVDYVIDGITGYRCEVNDYRAFAIGIQKLKNDSELHKRISKNCQEFVRKYDISVIKESIFNIVDNLMG